MKYKAGDEVLVKGEVIEVMSAIPYPTKVRLGKGKNAYVFSNDELCYAGEIVKTYEMGLNDAWELVKKVYEMDCATIREIFDLMVNSGFISVVRNLTAEEALAKIEVYEKEKEIKVGDVVKGIRADGIVTRLSHKDTFYVMWKDGSSGRHDINDLTKTGKHIDIESLLKEIGE